MSKMVKKTLAGVLMVLMLLAAGSESAFAAGSGAGKNFTDANEDGICDYRDDGYRYSDADNDGICDYRDAGCNYAYADNDGICDHAGSRIRHADSGRDRTCDNAACRAGQGNRFRGGHGR